MEQKYIKEGNTFYTTIDGIRYECWVTYYTSTSLKNLDVSCTLHICRVEKKKFLFWEVETRAWHHDYYLGVKGKIKYEINDNRQRIANITNVKPLIEKGITDYYVKQEIKKDKTKKFKNLNYVDTI